MIIILPPCLVYFFLFIFFFHLFFYTPFVFYLNIETISISSSSTPLSNAYPKSWYPNGIVLSAGDIKVVGLMRVVL